MTDDDVSMGPRMVLRTARMGVRATPAQTDRLYGLLRSAGDIWAALVELNRDRAWRGAPPAAGYQQLCRELTGVEVGELSVAAARSVLRRYSDAWFDANRRKRAGDGAARYPRRKRRLFPVRWYHATFTVEPNGRRVRLGTARGALPLVVRLARPVPYPTGAVRSVTLVADDGRLWLDVTAAVPVAGHGGDRGRVAGVDIGLIHPYVVAGPDGQGLVVSGRALRAEARIHLEDTKRRSQKAAGRAPKLGRASRRWRAHRTRQRRVEARHRRRLRQAHHEAAVQVVAWAVANRVGTIRVGDLGTILDAPAGPAHRWRTRAWRHGHLLRTLVDKAAQAGIVVQVVDERGTSSTCPGCAKRHKPSGRAFACPSCGLSAHRDLVGATNIARRAPSGGEPGGPPPADTTVPAVVQHRRAGRHLPGVIGTRRASPPAPEATPYRRHLWDDRRRRRAALPGSGPPHQGSRTPPPNGGRGSPSGRGITPAPRRRQTTSVA